MKLWGEVSSLRGANILFDGQQINGQTHRKRRETQKREREERSKERPETQIKEESSSRSKEEPAPLRDTTSEGHNTL
jgi:hypothetical protein